MNMIDYPNPVLSPERDDYVEECSFDVFFEEENISIDDKYISIPVEYKLVCKGLMELIEQEKAAVAIHVNSSPAFYRDIFTFDKNAAKILVKIPKFSVKKEVELCGYILAKEHISNFMCIGEFNELYFKNTTFIVNKADVLAKGETLIIPVDNSELEKPISSIFRINRNLNAATDIEANFDEDEKIIIELSEKLNQLYYNMKDFNNGSLCRYLTGTIVYPVLVEAIARMCEYYKGSGIDYSEKRWFRVIDHKLRTFEVNLEEEYDNYSYTELANRLLGDIAFDGLHSVQTTIDREVNGGEYINTGGLD